MITPTFVDRFNQKWKEDKASGCWLWTASKAGRGYGQIKIPGTRRQEYAHRLSYLIHKGEIPKGMQVCHTCDNPACVNPSHLFIGSDADNRQDMKQKGRHLYGSKNASAKLSEKQVSEIKMMLKAGVPQTRIARAYGISQIQISRINTGKRWAHVK